jgi:multiple sugar transport system substrate-binding protein
VGHRRTQEYNWTAPTFTAALAAGTLPDVFTIPFTDGKGLIQQHQIVNIDSRVRALPYVDKFNKSVLANGPGRRRQDLGRARPRRTACR